MSMVATPAVSAPTRAQPHDALRVLVAFLCFWLVPAAWVWLTPPFSEPHRSEARTRVRLASLTKLLHAYVDRYKEAPADFATLRAFAITENSPFPAYDAFGQRFDYVRLDGRHYLLRSFADDGTQNTPTSPRDLGVVNWGPRVSQSPTYEFTTTDRPHVFPAALLVGADSADGNWLAKLYVDTGASTRRLVVRHRTQDGLFMVAQHDAVEEFLWLPTGRQLVFTASGSTRHRDGLYLWNLETDAVVNLSDLASDASGAIAPTSKGSNLWLSLAGVAPQDGGAIIYAFRAPRHDGSLDPADFFTGARLTATYVNTQDDTARAVEAPTYAGLAGEGAPFHLEAHVKGTSGLKVQKAWLALPLTGDMEKALLDWHTYSERETQGPLFPYSLWLLSSLYGESFAMMSGRDPRDADVLRTFGTEIARALLNYPLAPTYIRALAIHTYESLMEGQQLPYRFSALTVPSGPITPPEVPSQNH